jgi:hypothetical protein
MHFLKFNGVRKHISLVNHKKSAIHENLLFSVEDFLKNL